jgi:predicted DNA-binding protein
MEKNISSKEVKRGVVSTQIRLPAEMHEYIKREADRMGIAQNAFLIILLEQGRKLWEAKITHVQEA